MKQYCRYCAFCFEGDGFFCSNEPNKIAKYMTEAQIKRANNCNDFALSDMGDVLTGKQYKSRVYHPKQIEGQMRLDI